MTKLTKTSTPGIFRRHVKGCPNTDGQSRCSCNYAVPRRHRGRQRMETFRTFEEARTAKGRQDAGETKPKSKVTFGEYFPDWIETYAGRTKRGFEEETRTEYRRSIENDALPLWEDMPMVDIDQAEIRRLYKAMVDAGKSHAAMKKTRGALSPLFNTAIEDRVIDINPVTGVKIPAPPKTSAEDEDDERGKALRRDELAAFMREVDPEWRLFFEFLTVTGLRIGEAIGLVWKNVLLTGSPRIRVREQIYEGRRKRYLKSEEGRREIPLTAAWAERLSVLKGEAGAGDAAPVFASAVGTPLSPGNVYRRVLAPAAIDAGIYVEVGPQPQDVDLVTVIIGRSGRRHQAEASSERTLCGRKGTMTPAPAGVGGLVCSMCEQAVQSRARAGRKTAIAFHAFRHTCASLLFAEGRNVKQVSKWLGHADPAFTLRVYISLLDEGLGEGLELPMGESGSLVLA